MSKLPTQLNLLICDAVREETRNKMTLLGYFGGLKIRIDPGTSYPVGFPLGAVIQIADGEGTFKTGLVVHTPGGNVTAHALPDVTKIAGEPANIILNFGTMVVPAPGKVDLELKLDGHSLHCDFEVV